MVDHRDARLLRVHRAQVEEVAQLADEQPRQVDTTVELGGFQRHRDEAVRRHLRRVGAAVDAAVRDRPPDRVILAGQPDTLAELERHLRPEALHLVVGRIRLPMTAADREVAAALAAAGVAPAGG